VFQRESREACHEDLASEKFLVYWAHVFKIN